MRDRLAGAADGDGVGRHLLARQAAEGAEALTSEGADGSEPT